MKEIEENTLENLVIAATYQQHLGQRTCPFCAVSILGTHLPPGLVDVLHLIGVVSHARKIDQRQLRTLLANHAHVQRLQARARSKIFFVANQGSRYPAANQHRQTHGIKQAWLEMNSSPVACFCVKSLICSSTCSTVHFFALAAQSTTEHQSDRPPAI